MDYQDKSVDFICQHCADGSIIPLKFRIKDEDGELRDFKITGYKDVSDMVMTKFECGFIANGVKRKVTIYNTPSSRDGVWRIKF